MTLGSFEWDGESGIFYFKLCVVMRGDEGRANASLKQRNAELVEAARVGRGRERRLLADLQRVQKQVSAALAAGSGGAPLATTASLALTASRRQEKIFALREENDELRFSLRQLQRSVEATRVVELDAARDEAIKSFRNAAGEVRRLTALVTTLRKELAAAKLAASNAAAGWVTSGDAVRDELVRDQVRQHRLVRAAVEEAGPAPAPRRAKRAKRRTKAATDEVPQSAPSRRDEIFALRHKAQLEEREIASLRAQAKRSAVQRRKAEAALVEAERARVGSAARASKASERRERALAAANGVEASARAELLARELKAERARSRRLASELSAARDAPRATAPAPVGADAASQGGALRHVREKKKRLEAERRQREDALHIAAAVAAARREERDAAESEVCAAREEAAAAARAIAEAAAAAAATALADGASRERAAQRVQARQRGDGDCEAAGGRLGVQVLVVVVVVGSRGAPGSPAGRVRIGELEGTNTTHRVALLVQVLTRCNTSMLSRSSSRLKVASLLLV